MDNHFSRVHLLYNLPILNHISGKLLLNQVPGYLKNVPICVQENYRVQIALNETVFQIGANPSVPYLQKIVPVYFEEYHMQAVIVNNKTVI